MGKDIVTVFSTRATDIILDQKGEVLNSSEGGPAYFIERALTDAAVPFTLEERDRLVVEIEVESNDEHGRVPNRPQQKSFIQTTPETQWCLVSTLLDEWTIGSNLPNNTMIDVQGYVRNGVGFGLKHHWPLESSITRQIFCIKGTSEELEYIPDELINDQKEHRMLVETRGRGGAIIYNRGEVYTIPAQLVVNPVNTVGAGDTFFAYYAAALYRQLDPKSAGSYAAQKTADFLESKQLV